MWLKKLIDKLRHPRAEEVDKVAANSAWLEGHSNGYKVGYTKGFDEGKLVGFDLGRASGYNEGIVAGQQMAKEAALKALNKEK